MPYAPTVNDRSGEILAQHQINAANMLAGAKVSSAETRAAGNEALTKGIVDGATSAIGGITGGIMQNYTKAAENKMTSEYLDQMAYQFTQTPGMDGKTPLMSQDELDKFSKMSLGAKQGMIVPKQAIFDQSLKNQYLAAQIQGFGQRQSMQNQVPANQQPVSTGGGGVGGVGAASNNFNHQNWAAGIKGNQ